MNDRRVHKLLDERARFAVVTQNSRQSWKHHLHEAMVLSGGQDEQSIPVRHLVSEYPHAEHDKVVLSPDGAACMSPSQFGQTTELYAHVR